MKNLLFCFIFLYGSIFAGIGVGESGQGALPVELTSLTASVNPEGVTINWVTATEVNNYGFEIEKKYISQTAEEDWKTIAFIPGHGNSNSEKKYSFLDAEIMNGTVQYRLKQIDTDGKFKHSKVIEVNTALPEKFELSQNYPNPFNPSTTLSYSLPAESNVTIKVYDMLGNEVRTLIDEKQGAGKYQINFDASGLSSGIYFYRIMANSQIGGEQFIQTRKMSIIK